jgi:putative endonuclease
MGFRGEMAALAYLTSCGWSIEAHRFRLGRHDLDLIVRQGGVVAFVEVKTRRGVGSGAPLESLSARQRASITRLAEVWRVRYGRPGDTYRFDVVGVFERAGGGHVIEHVPDAWRAGR